jgi:hypothetical protein
MIWFLSTFPYLIHVLLLVSIAGVVVGFFSSKFPFIGSYGTIIKIVSSILLVAAVYLEGSIANNEKWEAKVAEMKKQIEVAEAKSNEENVRIETKVVERIKYVRGKTEVVVARVPIYLTKEIDAKYPVPNAFVVLHDSAARSEVPPSTGSSYEGTSDVKISEVARTVAENYGTCNEVRQQLLGWQDWYRKQRQIYESIKK